MSSPATGPHEGLPEPPARHAIIRCAHGAGNSRRALQLALDAGVDLVEVDVWYANGRLHARHERAVWRLPVIYDKWRVELRPELFSLTDLLFLVGDHARVLVDVKGANPRLPSAIAAAVRSADAAGRVAICGQYWPVLDAIAREEPRLDLYHSLGQRKHFAIYRQATPQPDGVRVAGVSALHKLLTEADVRLFQARGLRVIAWTVNKAAEAGKLADWGVDGITSDRLDLLAQLP
jgi:glycerophosphoryl diester phosphodiesterase